MSPPTGRQRGEDCQWSKLTPETVREIRRRWGPIHRDWRRYHREGPTLDQLAREYGVHRTTVHNLVRYRTWGHVE